MGACGLFGAGALFTPPQEHNARHLNESAQTHNSQAHKSQNLAQPVITLRKVSAISMSKRVATPARQTVQTFLKPNSGTYIKARNSKVEWANIPHLNQQNTDRYNMPITAVKALDGAPITAKIPRKMPQNEKAHTHYVAGPIGEQNIVGQAASEPIPEIDAMPITPTKPHLPTAIFESEPAGALAAKSARKQDLSAHISPRAAHQNPEVQNPSVQNPSVQNPVAPPLTMQNPSIVRDHIPPYNYGVDEIEAKHAEPKAI